MTLTPEERTRRIEQYASAPTRLRRTLVDLPPEAMKWRPESGEFSVHEIVCHCADSETNAYSRIRYLLTAEKPVIVGYDPDTWAREFDYANHPLDAATPPPTGSAYTASTSKSTSTRSIAQSGPGARGERARSRPAVVETPRWLRA